MPSRRGDSLKIDGIACFLPSRLGIIGDTEPVVFLRSPCAAAPRAGSAFNPEFAFLALDKYKLPE